MMSSEPSPGLIPRPPDEERRLAALHRCLLLDTPAEDDFDFLTDLAAHICEAPCACLSLVDRDRVWIKSQIGMSAPSRPRDDDYCSWAVLEEEVLAIPDLASDPRTAKMSMTVGPPGYRMYTGAQSADLRRPSHRIAVRTG